MRNHPQSVEVTTQRDLRRYSGGLRPEVVNASGASIQSTALPLRFRTNLRCPSSTYEPRGQILLAKDVAPVLKSKDNKQRFIGLRDTRSETAANYK